MAHDIRFDGTQTMRVRNQPGDAPHSGLVWTVRIVRQGDRYGRDGCLVFGETEAKTMGPLVEFYDARYDGEDGFTLGAGQFVSRYYCRSLLEREWVTQRGEDCGLDLDGGVADWKVDAPAMRAVRAWLEGWTTRS